MFHCHIVCLYNILEKDCSILIESEEFKNLLYIVSKNITNRGSDEWRNTHQLTWDDIDKINAYKHTFSCFKSYIEYLKSKLSTK